MLLCAVLCAGKIYALKQMSKGHIIDNKLVAHVHREKNVSGQHAMDSSCQALGRALTHSS